MNCKFFAGSAFGIALLLGACFRGDAPEMVGGG